MHGSWLSVAAVVASACLLAPAAIARDYEVVPYNLPGDFQLANQQRDVKAGYSLLEYVRKGDTLEDWDELFTFQSFALKKWGGASPDEVLEATQRAREQACPGATTWRMIARDAHRVVYEWQTNTPCMGYPPQQEIAGIFFGKLDRFRVAYTTKAGAVAPRDRNLWVQVFETLSVYYKDARVWGHPRSDPPAFIRDMLATGQWMVGRQGIAGIPLPPDSELAFINVSHAEDSLQFTRKNEPQAVSRFQELGRIAIDADFSLQQWYDQTGAKIQARQDKDCPGGYATKQILEEPGRIIEEATFRECKQGPNEQRITVVLQGKEDLFIWVDAMRPAWIDESQRSQVLESAMNLRLVDDGENTSPAN